MKRGTIYAESSADLLTILEKPLTVKEVVSSMLKQGYEYIEAHRAITNNFKLGRLKRKRINVTHGRGYYFIYRKA